MSKFIFILISLSLVACSVSKTKLSSDGQKVKILTSKNNEGCNVIDKIVGENEKGSDELAKNHTRNLAADLDGNAIFIDEIVNNSNMVKVYATVYKCGEDD